MGLDVVGVAVAAVVVVGDDDLPFGNADEEITTEVYAAAHVDAKMAAMRAHRSQIAADGVFFAYPEELVAESWGNEYYILARRAGEQAAEPQPTTAAAPEARERDLFEGL
ncbi:MAG TPA: hypothetical protein VEZ46_13100 [Mycobacteriales bacterium]|nr:hypothetical protein [Mycobacteriales bacterium]